MTFRFSHPSRWTWFSPWLIIGSVCILAGILLVLAVKNVHREKEFIVRALLSQANILMRSIEASSRTGMGMGWGRRQHQLLLEETAEQSDVLYIALLNQLGQVVAHSDPVKVGKVLPLSIPQAGQTSYQFSDKEQKSFEVLRSYQPWFRQRRHAGDRSTETCPVWASGAQGGGGELFIMVGLDPKPFEDAHSQDMHQTILLFGIMFLVGAAGFLSLIWAQHYRTARSCLQDIRAFTSTIVNQMPVGMITTDQDGRIEKANESARLILRQPKGITGMIDDFPCFLPIAGRLKREERVIEQEIQCCLSYMGTVPLLVNAAHIRDGEGNKAGQVLLFTDMTNIKQLEEQLRRSERLAGLGRLAAGIAHEIRNPLSSIKGFAKILAGRFREDDRSRKLAEVMEQEVERLNRVVTELLDFARPTEIQKKILACGDLIQNSLRLVERDALQQAVRLESNISPEDLQVEVDPDRFTQVLLNLFLNALQAMEGGGILSVTALREDDQVVLRVSDSGPGIAAEHLPHVFDPYFTTKPKGVGLGLANVHKFIEAHGGEIEVESSPGRGTTFLIRLATATEEASKMEFSTGNDAGANGDGEGRYALESHSR